jgi:predicted ArsR family transcriptional regulator
MSAPSAVVSNAEMDARIATLAKERGVFSPVRVTHVDPQTLRPAPNGSTQERERRICDALLDGPMTAHALGERLAIQRTTVDSTLRGMAEAGHIELTGDYDSDSEHGGRLWGLAEEEPEQVAEQVAEETEQTAQSSNEIGRLRREATLSLLADGPLSTPEVAERLGIPTKAAKNVLSKLVRDQLIEDVGGAKTGANGRPASRYQLPEKAPPEGDEPVVAEPENRDEPAPAEPESRDETPPAVASAAEPEPTLIDEDTGEPVTFAEVFERALDGVTELATDEWMACHAQDALLRWARNGQPLYFKDDLAADAYFRHLLKIAEGMTPGPLHGMICDRIERVIWGHTLTGQD